MATSTFDKLKIKLDVACESLRGFTLGRVGITPKYGRNGIKVVAALCDKLGKLPKPPGIGTNSTALVALGRGRIKAAEARLALLKKKTLV